MKQLLTLLSLFSLVISTMAQVLPTLPAGAVPYGSQVHRLIVPGPPTDTLYFVGSKDKGYVKLAKDINQIDSVPLPKLIVHPYNFGIITDNVLSFGKDGIIAFEDAGKFYLVGGWNPGEAVKTDNEQWVSENFGQTWTQLADAPFTGRHTAASETANGKTYVVGGDGYNLEYDGVYAKDAWVFDDGVWTEITADAGIGERIMSELVYHSGAFYLIGGQVSGNPADGVYTSVLKSTDGLETFVQITNSAPFAGNIWGAAVSFKGKIWKVGGGIYSETLSERTYPKEIYSSVDGVNWNLEGTFPGVGRSYAQLSVFDNKLVLSHGFNHLEGGNLNDVWVSSDGVEWVEIEIDDITRHAHAAWVFNDELYWAGGSTNELAGIVKDVVKLTRAGSLTQYIINSPTTVSIQPTPNTVVKRDTRGYLEGVYLRSTNTDVSGAVPHTITGKTDDGYLYQYSQGTLRTFLGFADVALTAQYGDLLGRPTVLSQFTNDVGFIDGSGLADVATTAQYSDLLGKPTALSQFTNDVGYSTPSSLADVATTASYNDLINKPAIPSSDVAFSGSYDDLTNKPTVGDFSGKVKWGTGIYVTAETSVWNQNDYGTLMLPKAGTINNWTYLRSDGGTLWENPVSTDDFNVNGDITAKTITLSTGSTSGKVLTSNGPGVPATWENPVTGFTPKGSWNASTNTPSLADGVGTLGDTYYVGTAGTQFGRTFVASGLATYNGSIWQPVGANSGVSTINGFSGSPIINPTISGNLIGLDGGSTTINLATAPAITSKEPAIVAGSTAHYWRGDKTWQPLSDVAITAQYSDLIGEPNIALYAPLASPTFTGTVSGITKSMVGLGSADNTSDVSKPISTATQTALDLKAPINNPNFTGTVGGIHSSMIGGLADVAVTAQWSDLLGKPTIPTLTSQLTNNSSFITPSSTNTLTNKSGNISQWNNDALYLTPSSLTGYATLSSPTFTGTVSGITKSMVGLGSVDNTSDVAKPVSTATQTALNLKANIASPTFTGTVSGITAAMVGAPSGSGTSTGTNTGDQDLSTLAPKANPTFTGTVSGITASMVGAPSGSGTSTGTNTGDQDLSSLAPKASPAFTGSPTAPTQTAGDNSTKIATTAYVATAISSSGITTTDTYVPTCTAYAGISSLTPRTTYYTKTGDMVRVDGTISVTSSSTGYNAFKVSLPFASDLDMYDLTGVAGAHYTTTSPGVVWGETVDNVAIVRFQSTTTTGIDVTFSFTYKIK